MKTNTTIEVALTEQGEEEVLGGVHRRQTPQHLGFKILRPEVVFPIQAGKLEWGAVFRQYPFVIMISHHGRWIGHKTAWGVWGGLLQRTIRSATQ